MSVFFDSGNLALAGVQTDLSQKTGDSAGKGSLVQRELSAKLTEGLFDCGIDVLTDPAKILIDFVVGNANNR